METNKEEITEHDVKECNELYLALRKALENNDFKPNLPVLTAALSYFLNDVSAVVEEQGGIDSEYFIDEVAITTKSLIVKKKI